MPDTAHTLPTPLLYRLSRQVVRLGMRAYFNTVEITGRERAPGTGPVIFAANHPHSITDALVLGHAVGRMLHFLAHSGLFAVGWKAWFLRQSGVIPVYRAHEVADAATANTTMFAACHDVLARGGAIGIFPEGTSAEERRVQKLKTGAARIALGAEADHGWGLGVSIVPVGLNFESANRFRSRVLVRFGRPLAAAEWRDVWAADPVAAANDLTAALQTALQHEVVNVASGEYEQLVRDVEMIYRRELLGRVDVQVPGRSDFQRAQNVSREFARALDHFQQRDPELLWGLARRLRRYHVMCRTLKVRDDMLRDEHGPTMPAEVWRFAGAGLAGLPLAVIGLAANVVPYKLTGWIAAVAAPDRTKVHLLQFILGALFFLPWYGWLAKLLLERFSVTAALLILVMLPAAGLFALRYFRFMGRRRRMIRLAWLELGLGLRIGDMRRRRQALIHELDAAMARYVAEQGDAP